MGCNDLAINNSCSTQLEHTRYFSRQLITADDLTQDQNYYREKRRMHNRLLHGWGIVCGLDVKMDTASPKSLIVTICPGYALSPQGDEIYVPAEVKFDLGNCIKGQEAPCHSPCGSVVSVPISVSSKDPFYIAIKFTECPSHPVRVPTLGCGCDDTGCEYSRIRDGYELTCLGKLPDAYSSKSEVQFCDAVNGSREVACPPCSDSPWIVLAEVHVTGAEFASLANDCRRILLSATVVQEHLREQCY